MTTKENGKKKNGSKQRRKELFVVLLIAILVAIISYVESVVVQSGSFLPVSNNILVFGLINLNILLVILLIFLILRNIVKLIYERKHKVVGSKLRTKLIIAFVALSLVPTSLLFVFSTNFLANSIENWFGYMMEETLTDASEISSAYYKQSCNYAYTEAKLLADTITANALFDDDYRGTIKGIFIKRQESQSLASVTMYINHAVVLSTTAPRLKENKPQLLSQSTLDGIYAGKKITSVENVSYGTIARATVPIYPFSGAANVIGAVVVDILVDPAIAQAINNLKSSHEKRQEMMSLKTPIKLTYVITLLSVTLLIIFAATWFGLLIAKKITEPIADLADATRFIADGNLEYQIEKSTEDEIGTLVDSFNQMTLSLKNSNAELQNANTNLEERRIYIETVLQHASTGVISVDENGVATTMNNAAQKILNVSAETVLHNRYSDILPQEYQLMIDDVMQELSETAKGFITKHVELLIGEQLLEVLATVTRITDENGIYKGMVLVFDDMTQLQQAERAAAWREVAKKMAHEVKNPLTPIQLSAQRLQKRFGDKILDDDGQLFIECTQTIIEQVEVLKKLVNAFSQYAKLPVTELMPNDINNAITEPIKLFMDAHKDIAISLSVDDTIPRFSIDAEKINRVMINILDNAVASLENREHKVIEVTTMYDRLKGKARVEIRDNGRGIAPQNKTRIFEPYFSTKKTGTGLGLAIVNSIITDHGGIVGIADNKPRGTVVFFEIPVPKIKI
ncbi:MAG: ATP-binding protein [Deltaproteobacteria bacterium]